MTRRRDDKVRLMGPFIYTDKRVFYRDDFDTLWEIRVTGRKDIPFEYIKIAEVVESGNYVETILRTVWN